MKDQNIIQKIINWSLQGNSRLDLINLIKTHSGKKLTNLEIDELIQRSKQVLAESSSMDREQTINIHVILYENLFKYFYSIDHTAGMLKAMQQKEKLLGLVSNGTKITINRKTEVNLNHQVCYDPNRLSIQNRIRLKELYDKMEGKS